MSITTECRLKSPPAAGYARQCRGSAALEALMLVVFLIVPMWMLLFNMGYGGARLTDAQSAARLAAYEVLKRQTAGDNAIGQEDNIAGAIEGQVFPDQADVMDIEIEESSITDELGAENDGLLGVLDGVIGALSGNMEVSVSVTRTSPFELFEDSSIEVALETGGTPYTYCEMDNAVFNPFTATEDEVNIGLGILEVVTESASYILAPFGGLPLGNEKC